MEEFAPPASSRNSTLALSTSIDSNRFLGGLIVPDLGDLDDAQELIPVIALPGQLGPRWRNGAREDWRRLCAAVLVDAVETLQRPLPGKRSNAKVETLAWFAAPDAEVSIKLRDVCDGLGLDIGRVQKAARWAATFR
jgi:hypothetical protein